MNFSRILAPFSILYAICAELKNQLYDWQIIKPFKGKSKIISVGNITSGGSGKTPMTIFLAEWLRQNYPDLRLAIVSRGYGRKSKGIHVVADYNGTRVESDIGGDEPVMMSKAVQGIPVIVVEKRSEGIKLAEDKFKSQLILLDDAFQHRAVSRDLNIVLIDERIPAWHWQYLPMGRIREHPTSLKRADLIILTGNGNNRRQISLKKWLSKYTSSHIITARLCPSVVKIHNTEKRFSLDILKDQRLIAFGGIARPQRFFEVLESLGIILIEKHSFPDHADYGHDKVDKLLSAMKNPSVQGMIMTEKDAVKWPETSEEKPIYILEMKMEITSPGDEIKSHLSGIVENLMEY